MNAENAANELTNKVYELLETTANTGKIRKGTNEVTKAIERSVAKLVVVAKDVDPKAIVAHLPLLCKERNIAYIEVPSKKELGASINLKVSCASAALVDEGDARKLFKEVVEHVRALNKKQE
ncbi:50S ribosomal protein L7ae [archaeon CG10_big_fil_rev_8_21_14_0_10_43_11]|nr:MAG: 50S ribosomal protein L7ae [archaeon CG10_big_fil_rev_8_21_14_0_10_43_11]